jgi:hypothetical protein
MILVEYVAVSECVTYYVDIGMDNGVSMWSNSVDMRFNDVSRVQVEGIGGSFRLCHLAVRLSPTK